MARTKGLVVRVLNPLALKVPEVRDLFEEAFTKLPTLAGGWSEEVEFDLVGTIANPRNVVLVGQENDKFKACMIAHLPATKLAPLPFVYLIYNKGTKMLMKQMATEAIALMKAAGYTRFQCVNVAATDEAYARVFAHVGKAKKAATLLEFEVK